MSAVARRSLGIRPAISLAGWRYVLSPAYRLTVNKALNGLSKADRMEAHLALGFNLVVSTGFAALVLWLALGPLMSK